jgi:hypothetical protein
LNYSAVIVVLNEGVVVKTGVEGNSNVSELYTHSHTGLISDKEIEFAIRINREGYASFIKNEVVAIVVPVAGIDLIRRLSSKQEWTCHQYRYQYEYSFFHNPKVLNSECNYLHPTTRNQTTCQKIHTALRKLNISCLKF